MNKSDYYKQKMIVSVKKQFGECIQTSADSIFGQLLHVFSIAIADQEETYMKEIRSNKIMNWLNLGWLCIITTLLIINWSQ